MRAVSSRTVVVLPAPLGPRSPRTSPRRTSSSIPRTAQRSPNRRPSPAARSAIGFSIGADVMPCSLRCIERGRRTPIPLAVGLPPYANGATIGAVIAVRLLVLAVGVALGVFYPFIAVVLNGFGFSPGEIGVIASIGAVGFTIAVPAWGHLADVRLGRPRTLQVCAIGAGLAIVALLLPWPAPFIAVLFAVFWVFESSWQPLADAVTVNALRGRDYGRVRLLTSLSFAIGTIVAGFIYNVTGYEAAFVLFGLAALSMAVIAAWVPD